MMFWLSLGVFSLFFLKYEQEQEEQHKAGSFQS